MFALLDVDNSGFITKGEELEKKIFSCKIFYFSEEMVATISAGFTGDKVCSVLIF